MGRMKNLNFLLLYIKMIGKRSGFAILFFVVFARVAGAQTGTTLKFGTLAPSGSAWVDAMMKFKQSVESQTKVKVVIYSGGVLGDESEMVRKLKEGKIQGGAFIVKAMKEIAPELDFLDVPFLFESYDEVRYIYENMRSDFEQLIDRNGFVLAEMSHHGFVKFFSVKPIRSFYELKNMRTWAWHGEPMIANFLNLLEVKPIFVEVTELLNALSNGLVETFQTTPLGCLSMQWCKIAKYVLDYNYRYEPGIVVISKGFFSSLSKNERDIIISEVRKTAKEINTQIERIQKEAESKLVQMGFTFSKPSPSEISELKDKVQQMIKNKIKGYEYYSKVIRLLEAYRKKKN